MASERKKKVSFDYIKSNAHRVFFVSGAHGGPSPNGRHLFMSLFNERAPIPQRDVHELTETGELSGSVERTMRCDVVREVEATVVFDLDTARALRAWLNTAIHKTEEAVADKEVKKK